MTMTMTRHSKKWGFTLCAWLAAAGLARGAGPELRVGASCESTGAAPGSDVAVGIAFAAGTDESSGRRNEVAAVDFTLRFDPGALTVTDVSLAPTLAESGRWEADWEGSLGRPSSPGSVTVALAPKFAAPPLPSLPDGPLVEVTLAVAADAAPQCSALGLDGVEFSTPPLGLPLAAGDLANGAVDVGGEGCADCRDNNGDGLLDLGDPDCGAQIVQVDRLARQRKNLLLKTRLARLVSDAEDVQVTVVVGGSVLVCERIDRGDFKRKKGNRLVFKARRGSSMNVRVLTLKRKRSGGTKLTATLRTTVSSEETSANVSLHVGGDRLYARTVPILTRGRRG
jgi:hypothetical protein